MLKILSQLKYFFHHECDNDYLNFINKYDVDTIINAVFNTAMCVMVNMFVMKLGLNVHDSDNFSKGHIMAKRAIINMAKKFEEDLNQQSETTSKD